MSLGYKREIYDEWEAEHDIPFQWEFEKARPLDSFPEILLDECSPFEQLVLMELDEIRLLLKGKQ